MYYPQPLPCLEPGRDPETPKREEGGDGDGKRELEPPDENFDESSVPSVVTWWHRFPSVSYLMLMGTIITFDY